AAEDLGFQPVAPSAELEDLVDEELHRVHSVAPARADVAVGADELALVGEHEMVHAADAVVAVAQARRYARAEHRDERHVHVGRVVLARQDLRRLDLEVRVEVAIRLVVAEHIVVADHAWPPARSYTVWPRRRKWRPWSRRLSAWPAKKSPCGLSRRAKRAVSWCCVGLSA